MKLCIFIDDITHTGGIERVTSILCSQFSINCPDIDIDIVSQFRSSQTLSFNFSKATIKYLSDNNYDAKPHSFSRMIRILGNVRNVRRYFKRNQYDVIIGQSFPNNLLLFLAGVDMSGVIPEEHVYYDYYGAILKQIRLFVYKRCRKVVVLTTKDKARFDRHYPEEHTVVIPNPVDLNKRFQSALNEKIAIAVGRLEYQKGFDTLIDVFKKVHTKHPDWILLIYGDGNLRSVLERQIFDAGLSRVIKLQGRSTDIYTQLRAASFFILPSRFEGFPMVLVESQSQGIPAVSFDCPNGPSDIITNGVNGILVENQDMNKFFDGICYMIEHPDERKRMGKAALANVSRYESSNICRIWVKLFEDN